MGCQFLGYLNILCHAATENGDQQKLVIWNIQRTQQFSRAICARIRQANCIGKATGLVLGQHRFAIAQSGFGANTFGSEYADLWDQFEKALDDVGGAGNDA